MTVQSKDPQGFNVTPAAALEEANRALASGGDPFLVPILDAGEDGLVRYAVKEDVDNATPDNRDIQEVGLRASDDGRVSAYLQSYEVPPSREGVRSRSATTPEIKYTLTAHGDGRVELTTLNDRGGASEDVTAMLAAQGVTAADIRAMQERIAFDGVLDRTEQDEIQNTIRAARGGDGVVNGR